jgi:uncharacterized protein YbjT (DUF2867 family)
MAAGHKKIIVVVGATGAQGGGLARSILADPQGEFAVRAVTRNPASDKARALAEAGAEIAVADLEDAASVVRAFEGAHAAYCVTFFWHHLSADRELDHSRTLATAARTAKLAHVVWSTLEDSRRFIPLEDQRMPTLQGRYKVPHFDAKGEADEFFRASGVPTTFLLTCFYWDNLIHFGMGPKAGADGKLYFTLPMGTRALPGIAAEDIGRCAHALFKRANEFAGRTVGIAGEHLTGAQMAASLARALGREVVHQDVTFDAFRAFGFPGADDLGNMFQFNHDFSDEFCAARNVGAARKLYPGLQTFDGWLARHAREIPIG